MIRLAALLALAVLGCRTGRATGPAQPVHNKAAQNKSGPPPPGNDAGASAQEKHRTLESLLARGPVQITVDARRAEVAVPARFRTDPNLVLRFGYSLSPAISDLVVDDNAVSGTLSFSGSPFHVVLPWTAIYAAMVEGEQRGAVWEEDVPEDALTGGGETPAPVPP